MKQIWPMLKLSASLCVSFVYLNIRVCLYTLREKNLRLISGQRVCLAFYELDIPRQYTTQTILHKRNIIQL